MRKSVFYSLKTFTQGRLPSADASSLSISYKVDECNLGIPKAHDVDVFSVPV